MPVGSLAWVAAMKAISAYLAEIAEHQLGRWRELRMTTWNPVLQTLPLVAILRGLKPGEAFEIGEAMMATCSKPPVTPAQEGRAPSIETLNGNDCVLAGLRMFAAAHP